MPTRLFMALAAFSLLSGLPAREVPAWAQDAVWYQIFPERFRNGDPANDPTRASLDHPDSVPASWEITPWTSDWYARAPWEQAMGGDFYHTVYKRRYGGDLQGVIDKLDYLKDLGVTALYFNPLFYGDSLHKYDGNTFHHIDPYFGPDPEGDLALIATETEDPRTWQWTAADKLFLELIQEAHKRDMRVIIDGVWNHTGRNFFAFQDLRERQQKSRYRDWFKVTRWNNPATPRKEFDYEGWHGIKSLPAFAQTRDGRDLAPGPKRYVFRATERWMDPHGNGDTSAGVDGWRLDVAEELPPAFWRDWHAHVRSINPEAFTVAEIWVPARQFLEETHFDAAMNYAGFAIPIKGWLVDGTLSTSGFARRMAEQREAYPAGQYLAMQNLVDSHDTQRIASAIANRPPAAERHHYHDGNSFDYDIHHRVGPRHNHDYNVLPPDAEGRRLWKMVALFQTAYPGAPMIYYGTEMGMWGADDPDDRMPARWPDMDFEPMTHLPRGKLDHPIPQDFDEDIFNFYRAALRLRQQEPALRRGDFTLIEANDEYQLFVFSRQDEERTLVAAFNRGHRNARPQLPAGRPTLLLGTDPAITPHLLPPHSAALFALDGE